MAKVKDTQQWRRRKTPKWTPDNSEKRKWLVMAKGGKRPEKAKSKRRPVKVKSGGRSAKSGRWGVT